MKFPMYEKETKNKKYRDDPYRAVNFRVNEEGRLVCPNNKEFFFLRTEPVKGNQYGRTVELHQCEDCSGCPHRSKCHKSKTDRIIRLNYELTSFHKEVLENLNSIHGALLPGIRKPHISLILTIISLGTRVALSYALAPHTPLGVVAIWCSIPIGWFLADAAGLIFYIRNSL